MSKNLGQKSVESLVNDLVQGLLDVNELNLAKANQREAFAQALKKRPALLTKVTSANEAHFFKFAIESNYEYFVHLKRSQYTDELAQIYIFNRLTADNKDKKEDDSRSNVEIIVQKSMDSRTVLNISYVTAEGDELYYLDRELLVPLALKSSLQLSLKLNDACALIDRLDTHITQLGEQRIKSVITDIITVHYKTYLNAFIQEKEIGFYTLCTSLSELKDYVRTKLADVLRPYGLSISEFTIKKIAIPKDIQNKLEDQAFKIRQRRVEIDADSEFARRSLESYEAKMAIEQRYPDAEHSLTEYEKDLALKRYLTKKGITHEDKVDRSIKLQKKSIKRDSDVKKAADIVPDITDKNSSFRLGFFIMLGFFVFFSIIVMSASVGAGLILLGMTVLTFGIIAAVNIKKFSSTRVEPTSPTEGEAETVSMTTDGDAESTEGV